MYPQRSRPWIDKAIKTLVDSKQLKRFSTGVYYIPRKTVLGDSVLNPRKVIAKIHSKFARHIRLSRRHLPAKFIWTYNTGTECYYCHFK